MASGGEQSWKDFLAQPSDYVAPLALSEAFGGAISEETCDKLLESERFRDRLSKVIIGHYRLDEGASMEAISADDRKIATSSPEALEQIALRAGAIFWASSLAGTISGSRAAAMRSALGNELCAFALENRDLARAEDRLDGEKDVRDQVQSVGLACLKAWCDEMPASISHRFLLKIPEIANADDRVSDGRGPALIRRAAL